MSSAGGVDASDVRELIAAVERSEGAFDPYMLCRHVFTPDQETKWRNMVLVTFIEFCREELTYAEFIELRRRVAFAFERL